MAAQETALTNYPPTGHMPNDKFQRARLLIVDDEIAVVEVFRDILSRHGYVDIEGTTDPFDAVRLFKQWQPDIVVLDLLMPGLDGLQLLGQLRAIIPPDVYFPILIVTANPSADARHEALRQGASDFIAKPYDALEIMLRVDNLLETRFLHLEIAGQHSDLERRVVERTHELTVANSRLQLEAVLRRRVETALRNAQADLESRVLQRTAELAAVNSALVLKIAERRRAQLEAERANRAKSEFLSRMSHELRTPLNAILGFGQLMKTGEREADGADNVDQIMNAGRHLLAMVDDVLDIADADDGVLVLPSGSVAFGAAEPDIARLQPSGPAAPAPAAIRPSTVLYIEDNLPNLRLVERILARRPDITLLHAADGELGLNLAREHRPALILLDLNLPDIHGEQVLEELLGDPRTADIPVMVISADATPGQIERLTAAGARAYHTKPLDVGTFLAAVDRFAITSGEPAVRP